MNYKDYLLSDDWKTKRTHKLSKCKSCAICNSINNLNVHHLLYKNLFNVNNSDLRVLCKRCHFLGHELEKNGLLKYKGTSHNSKFTSFKFAVKKALGLTNKNLFYGKTIPNSR